MTSTAPQFSDKPPASTARRPCDRCGASVDPLRAPFVAYIDDGFRYYCSVACHEARMEARREHVRDVDEPVRPSQIDAGRPSVEQMADMLGFARESLPPDLVGGHAPAPVAPARATESPVRQRREAPTAPLETPTAWPLATAIAVTLVAFVLRALDPFTVTATIVVAALLTLASAVAASASVRALHRAGHAALAWALAFIGPAALLVSALRSADGVTTARTLEATAAMLSVTPIAAFLALWRRYRARTRLAALAHAIPSRATVARAGEVRETVAASAVRAGEEVVVLAGERVPVDGVVRDAIDDARIRHLGGDDRVCHAGVPVLAGAEVTQGSLRVLATRAGDDVALARLQRLADATTEAPRTLKLADRLVVVVPILAASIGAIGAVLAAMNGDHGAISLVWLALAAAPPALGTSLARAAYDDAARIAAERGIVFRDALAIEAAASVRTVVLCARGTISQGEPELVDVVSLGDFTERELLAVAASAEAAFSDQSLARAVLDGARAREIPVEVARRPNAVVGRGVTAVSSSGEPIVVGSRRLLLDEGLGVSSGEDVARMIEYQGRTAVFVAVGGRIEGVLGFEDPIREDARPAVQTLIDAGFELVLLGGMARGTLESMGERLDIANVRPEVVPEDRSAAVKAIGEVSRRVAVIGRPPRDSAALGMATIAISLSAAGAAVGETSVALAGDDLRDAAAVLAIAHDARERAVRIVVASLGGGLVSALFVALVPAAGLAGAFAGAIVAAVGAYLASR